MEPVHELDALVVVMVALTALHAALSCRSLPGATGVAIAAALFGLATEEASVWGGGTHCHADAAVMVAPCSSLNSVAYYIPWAYSSLLSGHRLGLSAAATPFTVGALMHGFCASYEMQGPSHGWWRYPDGNGVIASGPHLEPWRGGVFGHSVVEEKDGVLSMVTSPHAAASLAERWHGVPVMAALFHFAIGFGLAAALALTGATGSESHLPAWRVLAIVALAFPLALVWDVPTAALERAGVPRTVSAPLLIVCATVAPPLLFPARRAAVVATVSRSGSGTAGRDWLLFLIPLANHGYFATLPLRRSGSPPEVVAVSVALSALSLVAHARACLAGAPTASSGGGKGRVKAE